MSIRSIAQQGYAVWRGALRDRYVPKHWDDLSEEERECFTAVAAFALEHGAELQRRAMEDNAFMDELERGIGPIGDDLNAPRNT